MTHPKSDEQPEPVVQPKSEVVVPREATEAMIEAAMAYCRADRPGRASDIYRAMLAAAPQPEAEGVPDDWSELERLARAAKAARDAYDADDDGPDSLELSLNADDALEALDRVAQPYQKTILALIAASRRGQGGEGVNSDHGSVYDRLLTFIHDRDHALRGDDRTDPGEIDEAVLEIMRIAAPPAPSADSGGELRALLHEVIDSPFSADCQECAVVQDGSDLRNRILQALAQPAPHSGGEG